MPALPPPDIAACVAKAVSHYSADASRVVSVLRTKDGKSGVIRKLPNGEVEVGLSAIPGKEVDALASPGITQQSLADDDCLNVTIATYIIQRDILADKDSGYSSQAFAARDHAIAPAAQRPNLGPVTGRRQGHL